MSNKPIEIFGRTFSSEEEAQEYYKADLKKRLPELKKIEGFPIGDDEDILALSNPPFYTACPNPYINEFIKKYGKPYDEETDDYHCEPFVDDVSEGKNNPLYNTHAYHTKVPHTAIENYINHYTIEEDLVLDGFSGSGMSGIAAFKLKRNIILSDISPISTFISYGYNQLKLNPKNIDNLYQILTDSLELYGSFYNTDHYVKNKKIGQGNITSVIWSDVYKCPFCNQEYVFWENAVVKSKVQDTYKCFECNATITKKESTGCFEELNDLMGKRMVQKQVPVRIDYTFQKKRYFKSPDENDINLIKKIKTRAFDNWFPYNRMPIGDESRRNDKKGFLYVRDFFHVRTLFLISYIFNRAINENDKLILFLFTSVVNNLSIRYRYRTSGGGGPSGNLYVPALNKEWNVIEIFKDKLRSFKHLVHDNNSCLVSNQSITDLRNLTHIAGIVL